MKRLRAEFENGKAELEKEVERLLEEEAGGEEGAKGEATNQGEAATVESGGASSVPEGSENVAANSKASEHATKPPKKAPKVTLCVHVVQGEHAGEKFSFKKSNRMQVMIGRSTGKRFKKGGVSLFKDGEVSTTHGK